VSFGPPVKHEQCLTVCLHDKAIHRGVHCQCGSPWSADVDDQFCYGERYGYVFNFFRNLRPLIEQFAPEKCFFVLEGHPQFRYDLYSDYKANRIIKTASVGKEANEKFLRAKDLIVPLIQHLPITRARASAYEADDVVATLSGNMREEAITILSNDSDYIQLLQLGYPHLRIYNPIKKDYMVAPEYPYVAWKCLAGDKSDNIHPLLKPKKAIDTVSSPQLFHNFLQVEENRANFTINRQLIEFRSVPVEEIDLQEGQRNFLFLKEAFSMMKFETIVSPGKWEKFINTFNCIKY
jgi:hypothetical protein